MRTEKWCGHDIRFVLVEGEWYAILKDICDALGLKSKHVAERIPQTTMKRVLVDVSKVGSNDITSLKFSNKGEKNMLNEFLKVLSEGYEVHFSENNTMNMVEIAVEKNGREASHSINLDHLSEFGLNKSTTIMVVIYQLIIFT